MQKMQSVLWQMYFYVAIPLLYSISPSRGTELQDQFESIVNLMDPDIIEMAKLRTSQAQEISDFRELRPARVVPGESQCIYQLYTHLFRVAEQVEANAVEILLQATYNDGNKDYYFYDPEDLCFVVDDNLNVDIHKYDCSAQGVCKCGMYYGYVDLNVEQPDPTNLQKRYVAVSGLDRKLVLEDGECVSGEMGHCTLYNSSARIKLNCARFLTCVLDDSHGTILYNEATHEVYGLCHQRSSTLPPGESMIIYEKLLSGSPTRTFTTYAATPVFVVGLFVLYLSF